MTSPRRLSPAHPSDETGDRQTVSARIKNRSYSRRRRDSRLLASTRYPIPERPGPEQKETRHAQILRRRLAALAAAAATQVGASSATTKHTCSVNLTGRFAEVRVDSGQPPRSGSNTGAATIDGTMCGKLLPRRRARRQPLPSSARSRAPRPSSRRSARSHGQVRSNSDYQSQPQRDTARQQQHSQRHRHLRQRQRLRDRHRPTSPQLADHRAAPHRHRQLLTPHSPELWERSESPALFPGRPTTPFRIGELLGEPAWVGGFT